MMDVSYENSNPLKLICEFVNKNSNIYILEEWIKDSERINVCFSDTNAALADSLYFKVSDIPHILKLDTNPESIGKDEKTESIQFFCNRYINLLKEYMTNELINEKRYSNRMDKSRLLMAIGRFREYIMEEVDIHGQKLYETLRDDDDDSIHKEVELLNMEYSLSDQNVQIEEEALFRLVCAPYIRNIEEEQDNDRDKTKTHKNNQEPIENSDMLRSLTIPKMEATEDTSIYELDCKNGQIKSENYLDASGLNGYIKKLLEIHLKHHIDRLGKNGKIPKRKIYSEYGVTPSLLGSTNKTSDEVRQYDEDIKHIENELDIAQVIMISFLMYLRYKGRHEIEESSKFSKTTKLHQVINFPNSDITVPSHFIEELQEEIKAYAQETKISTDEHDKSDSKLVKLIESFLLSRFGLPSLNDYNNFSRLIDFIQYNVKGLLIDESDHISLLGIDSLICNITSAYNTWLETLHSNDTSIHYETLYNDDIEKVHSSLNISQENVEPLFDTSSQDSFIKQRFRALL